MALAIGLSLHAAAQQPATSPPSPYAWSTPKALLAPDNDEASQAAQVFRSPRWRAFVEKTRRESATPPSDQDLERACESSIHRATLASPALLLEACIQDASDQFQQAPPVRTAYSDTDGALLWEEALATFNGLAYDYREYVFDTQAEADDCTRNPLSACRKKAFRSVSHLAERSNELPQRLRDLVVASRLNVFSDALSDPAAGKWTVVHVTDVRATSFAGAVNPKEWVALHAATALPAPGALRSDPELRMRSAMNRIRSADELRQALATQQMDKAHIDARLSNGSTLLMKAIALKNTGLLDALQAEGAAVDRCDVRSCPLTQAVYLGDRASLRWLLAHGAQVEGAASDITPLMAASNVADREAAEILLQAGANPLATHIDKTGSLELVRAVAFYTPSSEPAYLEWLSGVTQAALARTGRYEWNAWIEQAGVRHLVADGASIALKRQPFKVVMRIPDDTPLRMATSQDEAFAEQARSAVFRRKLLGPGKIAASGPDSSYLGVGSPRLVDGARDFDGATQALAFTTDPRWNVGVKRLLPGRKGQVDVYEVTELILGRVPSPISGFTADSLTVLAGIVPPLGTGADFYKPARFRLVFR